MLGCTSFKLSQNILMESRLSKTAKLSNHRPSIFYRYVDDCFADEIRWVMVENGYPDHVVNSSIAEKKRYFHRTLSYGPKKRLCTYISCGLVQLR